MATVASGEPFTREGAVATLLDHGSLYELEEIEVGAVRHHVFKHGPRTVPGLFAASEVHADQTFLVFERERLSFAEVHERAARLARRLIDEFGVQKGDRVAIAMRNFPEWPIAYMAATSIGAVAVALNSWWTGPELRYGLLDSGSRVALVDWERYVRLSELGESPPCRLAVTRAEGRLAPGVTDMEEMLGGPIADAPVGPAVEMPRVEVDPQDDATILYTSGSTGRPKGAVSTHLAVATSTLTFELLSVIRAMTNLDASRQAQLIAFIRSPAARKRTVASLYPGNCVLVNVPLFHVIGANTMLLPAFRSGYKLVLMRAWDSDEAVRLIERERVTHIQCVPTMAWDIVNSPEFTRRDTSSLVFLGAGGAAQPRERAREIKRRGKVETGLGYGMTETNAIGTGIGGAEYERRPDSVGRPFAPLCQVKIIDAHGTRLPEGVTGEVCIKTAAAIRGYWNRPEATRTTLVDGWIHTGDLGHVDDEGFLFITDRAKAIIIRGGENISCSEVEACITEHPAVYEVAVYGVPDERLGERVAAAVLLRPEWAGRTTEEELRDHIGARLSAFKVPTEITLEEVPLPRLASGKLDRRALRTRAVEGEVQAPQDPSARASQPAGA